MADKEELKALVCFSENVKSSEYFYQYALPLHVKQRCLSCYGDKNKL
ncbi:hypothetical protein HUE87_12120 [Candidatus Sulfurimonas marisnigri]|uniref:Uncharacterized protein n=1 Tax=Candidatus Sulfurimonas marisnigri TaxID=2740405 RepID=A0A7S7M1M7_9BACT|nr:hypothetical protein HUE87_12120 [Candidatus Sulfurimonas marisnigri]